MAKWRSIFKEKSTETCAFKKKGNWIAGYHTGVDRVCNNKTIVAPTSCTVKRNEYDSSYGYFVVLLTDDGKSVLIAHMKNKSACKVGAKIKAGDTIGTMGNTGNSSGTHTHIEVENSTTWSYNKNLLNPNDYIDWNCLTNPVTVRFDKGSNYILTTNVNVRTGAGTNYSIKKVKALTADGQKNTTSSKSTDNAVLKKNTVVTALDVVYMGDNIWLKIPSGYICVYYKGNKYANWRK